MDTPNIFTRSNLNAPVWTVSRLSPSEQASLSGSLAVLVGINTDTGMLEGFGSGVLVGAFPCLSVLTAVHCLTWFTNRLCGALRPDAFGHDFDKEMLRVIDVLKSGKVKVLLDRADGKGFYLMNVAAAQLGNERRADSALLMGEEVEAEDFSPMMMDMDPVSQQEALIMAGFVDMPAIPIGNEERLGLMRQKMVVRASRIAEVTKEAQGADSGWLQWRLPMPSEGGMSGGPVFRLRHPKGEPRFFGHTTPQVFTAVGTVSRSWQSGILAGYSAPEGETFVTPMAMINRHPMIQALINYQDMEAFLKELPTAYPKREKWLLSDIYEVKLSRMQDEERRRPQ